MKIVSTLAICVAILLASACERSIAQISFQADFNGSGAATGETTNVVTFGGKATPYSQSPTSASIGTTAPLVISGDPGGYLHINSTANGKAGITITPTTAAHSPDGWFALPQGSSTFDTLNGGLDFFFSDSAGSAGWTTDAVDFRPLDINGGNGGCRVIVAAYGPNQLGVYFTAKNAAGTTVQSASAVNSSVNVVAAAVYHFAVTFSTNPSTGVITVKTYLAPGNTTINTASNNYVLATATTTGALAGSGTNAVTSAFNTTTSYWFGAGYGNSPLAKTLNFDSLRIYYLVPANFGAVEYLPDLPSVARPNPEPVLPTGFDLYSPPVVPGGSPTDNTAAGGEWTRTADPGDGLIVAGGKLSTSTGTAFGKDTAFLAYGQNTGTLGTAPTVINRLQGNNAAIELSPGLPASSMYLVWPRNGVGYGSPMPINQTEAWWIGPDIATRGDTVSLYGRNLTASVSGASPSNAWIYLKPTGTVAGQWITPTAANPYKVDFTVPSGLVNGTYEVWAHNSHGEHYGWSGPVLLTVNNGITWTSTQFNVMSYGALGNNAHDDTAAIKSAMTVAAASPYSTIYFPAGTYLINSGFQSPVNVRWLGASQTTSIIKPVAGTNPYFIEVPWGVTNVEMRNLQLNGGTSTTSYLVNQYKPTGTTGVSGFKLIDCTLISTAASTAGMLYLGPVDHMVLQGDTFIGGGITPFDGEQCIFDGCNFATMWDSTIINAKGHMSEISYTNTTGQDYDNYLGYAFDPNTDTYANDPNCTGWAQGVFFKGYNGDGAKHNNYFGNNTSLNLSVRLYTADGSARTDTNWGEQLSFEVNSGVYEGSPTSATSTNMTFSPASLSGVSTATPLVALIIYGTGQGQWRDIGSINTTTGVVNLAAGQAWKVVPDTTSNIAFGWYVVNVAAYQNNFNGKTDRVGPNSKGSGIKGADPYGGVLNFVFDSNTVNYGQLGVITTGQIPRDPGPSYIIPDYFHLYVANTLNDCQTDFGMTLSSSTYTNTLQMAGCFGIVTRANVCTDTVPNTTVWGIFNQFQSDGTPQGCDMVLYEQNSISGPNQGIHFNHAGSLSTQGNFLFQANAFNLAAGTLASSMAIDSEGLGPLYGFGGNTYTGYTTNYGGSLPGPILEVPLRTYDESAALTNGNSATDVVTVWNSGTSSLSWSVSSGASWLTVSNLSGSIATENSFGTFVITCNPAGLSAGYTYTGILTISSGSQTKEVNVNFAVLPNPQTYAAWQTAHFTTAQIAAGMAADNYDFDGSGAPNLLKYALGIDPKTGAGGIMPVATYSSTDRALQFSFMRDAARADISYVVEASPDLVQWTTIASSTSGAPTAYLTGASSIVEHGVPGTSQVNVTVEASPPTGNPVKQFMRLQVVQN